MIEVNWDNDEQTIIRYTVHDGWTWEDFYRVMDEGRALATTQPHEVHSIIDFSEVRHVLSGALTHFSRNARNPRSYHGLIVLVGINDPLLRALVGVITRLFPKAAQSLIVTDTLEEARATLIRSRKTA